MILAVDAGNSDTVFAAIDDSLLIKQKIRVPTASIANEFDVDGALGGLGVKRFNGAVVSSVVPRATPIIRNVAADCCAGRIIEVSHRIRTGIVLDVERPDKLGSDRIVNAAYGYHCHGGPLVVIDFGTATTFSVVSADGAFIGGAIMPGLKTSADALFGKAAQLGAIAFDGSVPEIGINTDECLRIGILEGHTGAVARILARMQGRIDSEATVVATGGLSGVMAKRLPEITFVKPDLTIDGLAWLYRMNL
ncbi:MAG: type III pantothenate kinase [Nitrospirae bacterium]|nr:type III pantothenate kinase [Nitrospirota bacterium]